MNFIKNKLLDLLTLYVLAKCFMFIITILNKCVIGTNSIEIYRIKFCLYANVQNIFW